MAEQDEEDRGGAENKDDPSGSEGTHVAEGRTGEEEPRPGETFKQGLGLLWKAAKTTAEEVKREVDKGRVGETLSQAGRELETAATEAARAVEQFIGRMGPGDPKMDGWPEGEGDPPKDKPVDADIPADGGTTEDGERRDMRIQVEEGSEKKDGPGDD